ncbi:invasion associated locus B family protein [Pseudovibrio exalbescens]|uniref:invasion associated locus B family protein n=1 Tax=Pseudovibrio exalbescens TaxID=197461 RepID=UPI000C9A2DD5|nr:invasion associated locus B family protein [Pseudovibrio exalbescens]
MYHLLRIAIAIITTLGCAYSQEQPSSRIETYSDWTLRCIPFGEEKPPQCQLLQELSNKQSGQRILAFIVERGNDENLTGTLLMPFGLDLQKGIEGTIDSDQALQKTHFSTCLPSGCLASLDIDDDLELGLRRGTALQLSVWSISAAQRVEIELSLKGFTAALNRLNSLMENQ